MVKDLTVYLVDQPGSLAGMGEALGNAGINIKGTTGMTVEGRGVIHLLVDDADAAQATLEAAGIEVITARDVLVVDVQPVAGELGRKARALAEAGVNIDLVYLTEDRQLVFGVDDIEKASNAM